MVRSADRKTITYTLSISTWLFFCLFFLFGILKFKMNDNQSSHSLNKVHKNDSVCLKSYVNKHVSVKTRDGCNHDGIVYTIDPVSESIILINPIREDESNMKIIMGEAIEGIEILQDCEISNISDLFSPSVIDLPESIISRRKIALKDVLLKNCFPVEENYDNSNILNIQNTVYIEPPYFKENCISHNEIVLLRIQDLVSSIVI